MTQTKAKELFSSFMIIFILIVLPLFISAVQSSPLYDSRTHDADQKYHHFMQGITMKRQSLKYLINVLTELDKELSNEENMIQKRGGCMSFGGIPAGDCENSDLSVHNDARNLLRKGGRNPGR